jgi:hypothetical protein
MINFFRKKRKKLADDHSYAKASGGAKALKYTRYAIGEIVLVVIGILIALQINNSNDLRKSRDRELHYLKNIKTDLQLNITELNKFLDIRNHLIASAKTVIEHFEGKPITNYSEFNELCIPIFAWKKFYQSNNTFQELVNSGNLALITNDSIKNILLNIELQYKKLKSEEEHYRYDMETTIYEPLYEKMDVQALINNFGYRVSNGQAGKNTTLTKEMFEEFINSIKLKNGFAFTIIEYETMNGQMNEMIAMSNSLIKLIDRELN